MANEEMMNLGGIGFSIDTAQYDTLTRTRAYRWAKMDRINKPALQAIGADLQTIELAGTAFPHWRGGPDPVGRFAQLADAMEELSLADGRGQPLGVWVIEGITETATSFTASGSAKKIAFTITLREAG